MKIYVDGLKPPLKWAGGKRWLVPHLRPIWEPYKNYRLVEPLCGGLAVTLGLMPSKALLNDINEHLINFYKWVRKGLCIELNMKNDKSLYYSYREHFNIILKDQKEKSKEAAELFYYLNRTGYNGLCRFNKKGEFNVPFGSYKKINYIHDHEPYQKVFKQWTFTCKDFKKVPLNENDFIYADPPYDVEFTHYSKNGFSWDDQVRLAKWLTRHQGPVVISNQATERIIDLYDELGFKLLYFNAPRMISCTGDRTPAREVLALKGIS